ncbi:MAG: DNA alkylation repair protein [Ardenticatenaceae bacterium]
MTIEDIQQELARLGDPERAVHSQRFFKTGPGEFGEGDRFRGIRVPVLRQVAKRYRELPLEGVVRLLRSSFHEDRLVALLILTQAFARGDEATRQRLYELYLDNTAYINNWDLVDTSAEHIVGGYLWERDREPLYRLAGSDSLWERRIAILATFHFIKRGEFEETLRLAEVLLDDPQDLIHKAVGWMLREVGNHDLQAEEAFLELHYHRMPRTMLRYAIEKFPEPKRQAYLRGTV